MLLVGLRAALGHVDDCRPLGRHRGRVLGPVVVGKPLAELLDSDLATITPPEA